MEDPAKLQIETTEINDLEICREGKFNAQTGNVTITEKMHDDFIKNFKDKIASPFLNLDHNDKMTDRVRKALKVLRLGTIKELKKKGKSLYASFKDVPVKIADLIKSGLMTQRSIEFSHKYTTANEVYDNVLMAVSMFGVEQPAIPGLEDYVEIFSQQYDNNEIVSILTNKEVRGMEIEKKEYEELIKAKAEKEIVDMKLKANDSTMEKMQTEVKKLQEEKDEVDKKVEEVEKKEKDIEKKEETIKKEKEENLKKEGGKYVNAFLGKQILPKFKDEYIERYVNCADNEEKLKLFKEDLESRGTVINLSAYTDPRTEDGDDDDEEGEVNTDDPEAVDAHLQKLDEKINRQVKKLKKAGETGDLWKKAREIVVSD